MPYCHNCGTQLVDGARFCTECGTPVAAASAHEASTPAPVQPNGYFSPAPQRVQPAKNRSNTALIVCITAAVVVLIAAVAIVLVLSLSGSGTVAQKPEKQKDAATEITPPPVTAQGIPVADIAALLESYRELTDIVMEQTTSDFAAQYNGGNLYDYDGDGYPELVLLYSLDGEALKALIVRHSDDEPIVLEKELWHFMAGGAAASIYTGTLDTGDPVVFLESTSWEGETKIGKDYVYSLSGSGIEYLYRLEWYADAEGDLINCWVFDADDELMSRDNAAQFMNIFNAREYCEAAYPSDQYGVALADLFSDEAMEAYFSLE